MAEFESNPCFISPDGQYVKVDGIYSHIGIAFNMLAENEELKGDYERLKGKHPDLVDFLVIEKGYVKVTDNQCGRIYDRSASFSGRLMTPVQKRMIMGLYEEGYKIDNMDKILYGNKQDPNRLSYTYHNVDDDDAR